MPNHFFIFRRKTILHFLFLSREKRTNKKDRKNLEVVNVFVEIMAFWHFKVSPWQLAAPDEVSVADDER